MGFAKTLYPSYRRRTPGAAVFARLDRAIQYTLAPVIFTEAGVYWITRMRG
jgi:hypothetical protein